MSKKDICSYNYDELKEDVNLGYEKKIDLYMHVCFLAHIQFL